MTINIDTSALEQVHDLVRGIQDGYKKVLVGAINTTATTVKVQAAARIGNELNLKAARIKQDFTIVKANYTSLSGAVRATGEPVGLVNFGAKQTQKGVTVKVLKASGRSLLRHAYIAKGRGNKEHVWWRSTPRNQLPAPKKFQVGKIAPKVPWPRFDGDYTTPIERRTGPRIEDIYAQMDVLEPIETQAAHVFVQNVGKKTDEVLRRFG